MPYSEDYLAHYGVLGMKWGVRKDPQKAYEKAKGKVKKINSKVTKNDAKAQKYFSKGVSRSGGLLASDKAATRAFSKSKKYSRKAMNQTQKGKKWIDRMEKEFSKQSMVSIEPEIIAQGNMYMSRLRASADTMYLRSL